MSHPINQRQAKLIAARILSVSFWPDGTVKTSGKTRSTGEKACLLAPCVSKQGHVLAAFVNLPYAERLERLVDLIYRYEGDNAGGAFTPGLAAAILEGLGLDDKRERIPINQAKRREHAKDA